MPATTITSGFHIDRLIAVVQAGGTVKTGVDVFNREGVLLLEKEVPVSEPDILIKAKAQGAKVVPINNQAGGGVWDQEGRPVTPPVPKAADQPAPAKPATGSEIERRINEIVEIKAIATEKYEHAKECVKQVLASIQKSGGEFDLAPVTATVNGLVEFVSSNDSAFSYLTREIFSYDDYLYNHSVNVCAIGTVIMKKFNENFSAAVNSFLNNAPAGGLGDGEKNEKSFSYFLPAELRDISLGFFMHDLGKVLIDPKVLNKNGRLTESEFTAVRGHVTENAQIILEKNRLHNPYIANVCLYHHARLYADEERCYPEQPPDLVPPYVKVCKLADIYDAMTSKRCYKEALNPVGVVTDIFNRYARKEPLLQYVLHSFVKSVGIYPPGSVVYLSNGQLCYVLESDGPVLLPLTDSNGEELQSRPEVISLARGAAPSGLAVDRRRAPISPIEAYEILPDYLRRSMLNQQPDS